jgi:glycosyltransferase involved in cell wall biosynthesis
MARPADSRGILGFDESVPIVLMVGRVVPNKNHLLALQAFAEFLQQGGRARLVIAGDATSPAYRDQIVCTAQRLGIAEQIFLTGKIRSDQLKALYLLADLLLVTSDHEGFCVPLLEAMRFHVPIVAVPRAAVPETAGPAACYAEHAHDLAAQMKTLRENRRLGEALRHAGRERYEAYFHPRVLADRFRALVRGLPFDQTPGEDHREDQRDAVRRPDSGQHRDAAIASHAAAGE